MRKSSIATTKAKTMVTCMSFLALSATVLTSCTKDDSPEEAELNLDISIDDRPMETNVTINFNEPQFDMSPMTRSSLASATTRLDVWIYESGSELTAIHQTSSDSGYSTISLSLDKTKTYTLYAIAHKATDACTLADGIISWPDDKPKESFFYTTTFSPATTTAINAEMSRITGKFTLQTTDAVPAEADHFRFIVKSTGTRYNVNGSPSNIIDRQVDFATISRNQSDGTCSFAFQILSTSDAPTNFDITATAYNASNEILETKTFAAVPIRNNYRTTYSGAFFTTSAMSLTFTADDWNDYDVVNF